MINSTIKCVSDSVLVCSERIRAGIIRGFDVAFFFQNEAPYLVYLDVLNTESAHFVLHQLLAPLASENQLLGALGGAETMSPDFLTKVKDTAAADPQAKAKLRPSEPQQASRAKDPTPNDGEIHVLPVAGNVYMLTGDGANIAVQIGPQGAFIVDTGAGKLADKVIDAVRKLSAKPTQFIVNTSFHPEHVGGNPKLQAAGVDSSLTGSFFSNQFADAGQGATIIGHQNVQTRMEKQKAPAPPSDTYFDDRRRKSHNGEAVEIFPLPNAITDGGTMIIPGHGRVTDEWEVAEYRDMLVIIRDRVQAMIKSGATLEQVKAARPTADYDVRFGATTGPWTTDMFVEAVYQSLTAKR